VNRRGQVWRSGTVTPILVGNNVFAHVPDIIDVSKDLRALVSDVSYVSIELAHLLKLIESNEYDTIYHEHFYSCRREARGGAARLPRHHAMESKSRDCFAARLRTRLGRAACRQPA
jgi:hypothetical protein